jgi:hypothetical protein
VGGIETSLAKVSLTVEEEDLAETCVPHAQNDQDDSQAEAVLRVSETPVIPPERAVHEVEGLDPSKPKGSLAEIGDTTHSGRANDILACV